MATWREISFDSEHAARELLDARRWRSCVSRAYYSVYARVTHQLARQGVRSFGGGRSNPTHDALPGLVVGTLRRAKARERRALKQSLDRLYALRVSSDYFPDHTVDHFAARSAVGDMSTALSILERAGGRP